MSAMDVVESLFREIRDMQSIVPAHVHQNTGLHWLMKKTSWNVFNAERSLSSVEVAIQQKALIVFAVGSVGEHGGQTTRRQKGKACVRFILRRVLRVVACLHQKKTTESIAHLNVQAAFTGAKIKKIGSKKSGISTGKKIQYKRLIACVCGAGIILKHIIKTKGSVLCRAERDIEKDILETIAEGREVMMLNMSQ